MKALVTRVHKAQIVVDKRVISSIKKGMVVFLGIEKGDGDSQVVQMAEKVSNLRVFENEKLKLDYSIQDKGLEVLCVSNFTLCANTDKGRRPSFENSMEPLLAEKYFRDFVLILESKGINTRSGQFGKHMNIDLEMDGPVNILLQTKD